MLVLIGIIVGSVAGILIAKGMPSAILDRPVNYPRLIVGTAMLLVWFSILLIFFR